MSLFLYHTCSYLNRNNKMFLVLTESQVNRIEFVIQKDPLNLALNLKLMVDFILHVF